MQEVVPSPLTISMMYNFRILLAGLLTFSVATCNGIPFDAEDIEMTEGGGSYAYEEHTEDDSTNQLEGVQDGAEKSEVQGAEGHADDETKKTVTKSLASEDKALYSTYTNNNVQLFDDITESYLSATDKLVNIHSPSRKINDVVMSPIGSATDVVTLGDRLAIGEMAYSNKAGELWLFNNDNRCIRRTYVAGSALSQPLDRRTCRKMRKEMLLMRVDAEEQADYMPYNTPYGANWGVLGANGYQMSNGVNGLQTSQYGSSPYNTGYGTGSGYGASNLSPNVLANSAAVYSSYQSSLPSGQGNTPVIGSTYPSKPGIVGSNVNGADGIPYGMPYYGANGMPYGVNGMTYNGANGMPYNSANAMPYNGANGVPYGGNGMPYNSANAMPYNGANGVPYNGGNGMLYNGANGMTYNGANAMPYNVNNGIPYSGVNGMTYNGANGMPNNNVNGMTGTFGTDGYNGANGKPGKSGNKESYGNNAYNSANGMQENYGTNSGNVKPSKAGTNAYNGANGMQENYNAYNSANGMQENYGTNSGNVKPSKAGTNAYNGANGMQENYGNYGKPVYKSANGADNGGALYTSSAKNHVDGNIVVLRSARKPQASSEDLNDWLQ